MCLRVSLKFLVTEERSWIRNWIRIRIHEPELRFGCGSEIFLSDSNPACLHNKREMYIFGNFILLKVVIFKCFLL
jgi:hypothetical protein